MASKTLALSAPNLLAEYVRQSEFKGFFEKRLAAPPDHMAMLIKNGEIIDAYKGAHFSVGGIATGLKSVIGGSTHISILLADLKPFSLQRAVKALSKDNVEIAGVATLELQLNPDKPENVLGLISPTGNLTREGVLERFLPHLTDRVFEEALGRVNAAEIRGDKGLQDYIQGNVMREIERTAGRIGLMVNAVSMTWAINAVEREDMRQAELNRQQETLDQDLVRFRKDAERGAEATKIQITSNVDLAKLQNASEDELSKMALNSEIEFIDARDDAQRMLEMKALAHEIEVFKTERVAKYRINLDDAGHTIDIAKQHDALRKVERGTDELDQVHIAKMRKLGAFTDMDITDREERMELERAAMARKQQREHLEWAAKLEAQVAKEDSGRSESEKDGEARRERERVKAEADARAQQFEVAGKMSEAQILAVNAGLSSEVAAVLVEQARAKATGSQETMAVMQDMVDAATAAQIRSEEQARAMFGMGMDGAVGVSHGAGGKAASSGSVSAAAASSTVECHKCGRENKAKDRFCIGCGNKLRT